MRDQKRKKSGEKTTKKTWCIERWASRKNDRLKDGRKMKFLVFASLTKL